MSTAQLTSAALAAAAFASSGLLAPSLEPNARPGDDVFVATFWGTGVRGFVVGLAVLELEPSGRPGDEKLSSLLADLEQMFPMVVCYERGRREITRMIVLKSVVLCVVVLGG